jgi:GTPase Era involved in 16S rRNA processing
MKKYLTKDELEKLETFQNALKVDEVSISCIGLYNHGKSTLLNALIGDFEDKTFKTADTRETVESKSVKVGNKIFVDTPGLNAKESDDKVVFETVLNSDINLFVHTVTTGEFSKDEIDSLNKIKTLWKNPQEFLERTIFVLSRVDKASNEIDVSNTASKMNKQLKDIFGVSLSKIVPISSIRYKKGRLENKQLLIEKSGIPELERYIANIIRENSRAIKTTKIERLNRYYDELIGRLSQEAERKSRELKKVQSRETELKNDISRIEDTLDRKYMEFRNI